MKNKIIQFFLMSTSLLLLSHCQTTQKVDNKSSAEASKITYTQWDLKALVKNTKTNEANVLSLDVIGQKTNPIRAEVSTSIGIHLASVLILENEIQFILPKSKRYFQGPITEKSLTPVLNVKLDPRLLTAALYDQAGADWKCEAQEGLVTHCETKLGEKITWVRAPNMPKHVEIKGEDYEVQVQFKTESQKTEIKENTFVLKVPENYKKFQLTK